MDYLTLIPMFAVSTDQMVNAVIWLVCIGLIVWLLWFLIDYAKIAEPFNKIAKVLLMLFAVILLIRIVLKFAGSSPL